MAYTDWAASTAFVVGDVRSATTQQASGLVFRCTTAGTSAATEPAWPTDIGSTITDGTVVWTAISSVYAELSKLAPSAIVELFELRLDSALHGSSDIFRWHNGVNADVTGNITWNGNAYTRLPVKAEGFEYTNTGTLPRPTLTVANLSGSITALLLEVNLTTTGNDLAGAEVRRIRTLKKYLDGEATADPNAAFPEEIWYVDRKATESRDVVSFELASKFDLAGIKLPRRQIVANLCQWQYRGSECGYSRDFYYNAADVPVLAAADDVCGKRVSSCSARFSNVQTTGTVTAGSSTLTLNAASLAIQTGLTVVGAGIPSGTTISALSSNRAVVTLSNNATSSTSVTVNGTIQQDDPDTMVVASATGLAVGMSISGINIKAGTIISSISGTTVTMSQPGNVPAMFTAAGTFTGQLGDFYGEDSQYLYTEEDELNEGQYVTGPGLSNNNYSKVTEEYYRRKYHRIPCTTGNAFNVCYYKYRYTLSPSGQATGTKDNKVYTRYNKNSVPTYSYTFTQSNQITFLKSDGGLPFGGFPGAGLIR